MEWFLYDNNFEIYELSRGVPLTIFKKHSILDVWLGSEYATHKDVTNNVYCQMYGEVTNPKNTGFIKKNHKN